MHGLSNVQIVLPNPITLGSTIIVRLKEGNPENVASVTDNLGNTYTRFTKRKWEARRCAKGGSLVVSFTFASVERYIWVGVEEHSG